MERRLLDTGLRGDVMPYSRKDLASITHIIVVESGCHWAKRAGFLPSYMRAEVVTQPVWEQSEAFVRRAVKAISSRPGSIVRVVLVGNDSWDMRALGVRSTIVRAAIARLGAIPDAEIVLCADLETDERAFGAMKAFAASLSELVATTVRIRCVRELPEPRPQRVDALQHAA